MTKYQDDPVFRKGLEVGLACGLNADEGGDGGPTTNMCVDIKVFGYTDKDLSGGADGLRWEMLEESTYKTIPDGFIKLEPTRIMNDLFMKAFAKVMGGSSTPDENGRYWLGDTQAYMQQLLHYPGARYHTVYMTSPYDLGTDIKDIYFNYTTHTDSNNKIYSKIQIPMLVGCNPDVVLFRANRTQTYADDLEQTDANFILLYKRSLITSTRPGADISVSGNRTETTVIGRDPFLPTDGSIPGMAINTVVAGYRQNIPYCNVIDMGGGLSYSSVDKGWQVIDGVNYYSANGLLIKLDK